MIEAARLWLKEAQNYGINFEHVLSAERSVDNEQPVFEDYELSISEENNAKRTTKNRSSNKWER